MGHSIDDTLLGADGETYAVAQGNLMVGGFGVEGGDGSSLTVNIPTVGRIPGGASVERMIDTPFLTDENIMLNLHQGDFSTTTKVSEAINDVFGDGVLYRLTQQRLKCGLRWIRHKKCLLSVCLKISKLNQSGHVLGW